MFGMSINTDNFNFEFDSTFTAYKLAGVINTRDKFMYAGGVYRWIPTDIRVPYGYNYLLMFSRGDCYQSYSGDWGGGTYSLPTASKIHYKLDENRQLYICYSNDIYSDGYYTIQLIWVIIYPSFPQNEKYGIKINGENENFSLITEASQFTKVLWKGDVYIPYNGISASDINPSFNSNMLSFFYWENSDITMGQVCDESKWSASWDSYGRYFAYNAWGYRTGLNAKMVIFGEKPVTQNNYGFEIYNKSGELVYSVADEVFREPEMVNPSSLSIDEPVNLQKIKRPMINPCSIGGLLYPFRFKGDVDRAYYDLSFANSGTSLIVRKSFRDDVNRGRHYAGHFFTSNLFPVFDASNYFNFGD